MNNTKLWFEDDQGQHQFPTPPKADTILELASDILEERFAREGSFTKPADVAEFLRCRIGGLEREVFCCLVPDNRHRLIHFEKMFLGTIAGQAYIHGRL